MREAAPAERLRSLELAAADAQAEAQAKGDRIRELRGALAEAAKEAAALREEAGRIRAKSASFDDLTPGQAAALARADERADAAADDADDAEEALVDSLEAAAAAAAAKRARARLELLAAHARAGPLPEHGAVAQQPDRVGDHARVEVVVDGDGLAQLLAGVGAVRNKLAQEDVPIRIDRMDHEVQKAGDIGLEGV